jgi:hypothetical protein
MVNIFDPTSFKNYRSLSWPLLGAIVAGFALFVGGLVRYPGSPLLYAGFTVLFTLMLLSGIYRRPSYGYLFLVVFLWLGFWLKLTVHSIFRYDYVEPIGFFDGSAAAWDGALWVPMAASMGILVGRGLYGLIARRGMPITPDSACAPAWYPSARTALWTLLIAVTVGLAAVNSIYGIQQSGLTPRTILFWPLNAVIYWLLSTGLSMCIATLLWWDICVKKDISLSIYAVFGEAFVSSMSLLSRGLYLFHIVPPLLAIYRNKNHLVWRGHRKFLLVIVISSIFFVVSLSFVSTLRSYLYQPTADFRTTTQNRITRVQVLRAVIPAVEQIIVVKGMPEEKKLEEIRRHGLARNVPMEEQYQTLTLEKTRLEQELEVRKNELPAMTGSWSGRSGLLVDEFGYQMTSGLASRVVALGIDRWIGIEGVMAVSSYPGKSKDLFLAALTERSAIGEITLYQKVCQSIYQLSDMNKYQFASLPGAAAFFYYTGSLWAVFLGMFLLTLTAIYSEYLVQYLTGNALLCALVGMNAANAIAQLGVVPRQLLIHFGMLFGAVVIIWLVQSSKWGKSTRSH